MDDNDRPPLRQPFFFTIWDWLGKFAYLVILGSALYLAWKCKGNVENMAIKVGHFALAIFFPLCYLPYGIWCVTKGAAGA